MIFNFPFFIFHLVICRKKSSDMHETQLCWAIYSSVRKWQMANRKLKTENNWVVFNRRFCCLPMYQDTRALSLDLPTSRASLTGREANTLGEK
jgi:hypothetical protein